MTESQLWQPFCICAHHKMPEFQRCTQIQKGWQPLTYKQSTETGFGRWSSSGRLSSEAAGRSLHGVVVDDTGIWEIQV